MCCCWGKEIFLFIKAEDRTQSEKGPPFLLVFLAARSGTCMRAPPSGLLNSILNAASFIFIFILYYIYIYSFIFIFYIIFIFTLSSNIFNWRTLLCISWKISFHKYQHDFLKFLDYLCGPLMVSTYSLACACRTLILYYIIKKRHIFCCYLIVCTPLVLI